MQVGIVLVCRTLERLKVGWHTGGTWWLRDKVWLGNSLPFIETLAPNSGRCHLKVSRSLSLLLSISFRSAWDLLPVTIRVKHVTNTNIMLNTHSGT